MSDAAPPGLGNLINARTINMKPLRGFANGFEEDLLIFSSHPDLPAPRLSR